MNDLARLQVETLQVSDRSEESSFLAAMLAVDHGFAVLGRGSSRVAVATDDGVAKVSHMWWGPAWNLQEMAVWQSFPEHLRQYLAPCRELTPELVLVQEHVDVLGPALTDPTDLFLNPAWEQERDDARRRYAEDVYSLRAELGLGSDRNPEALRLNNHGFLSDGRLVVVDYADAFPPLVDVWADILGERPTGRTLAERAGLTTENTDACPCYCGGRFGSGPCDLDADMAEQLALMLGQESEAEDGVNDPGPHQPHAENADCDESGLSGLPRPAGSSPQSDSNGKGQPVIATAGLQGAYSPSGEYAPHEPHASILGAV